MKDRRWIALCAIGLVVLVTMNLPDSASSRVKGAVRDGLSPLQGALRGGVREIRDIIRYVRGIGDLALENRALSEEIVYLRGEMRMARELERDNQMLRDLLGFVKGFSKHLVSCEVIGRDSTGWWQTIRLDKGAEAGVAEGRAVITPDGLIGRTVAVSGRTADVLLLSDPTCRVSVRLVRSGVLGVMEGLGGKPDEQPACRIDFISRTADVQEGDEVVSSGMGGVFPKGLLVGRVVRVEMESSGLYQTAWIDVAAKLGRSEYAFVAATEGDLAAAAKGMIEDLIGPAPMELDGESP
ncbi:MAG: rod shape-determining protein MreC [Kiritimatiellia bacterium]|jgi:rod shape-determining protein MreC|nr:rod shape-determining protein MreC [Kiritimatiellia bacterium]